MYKHLFFFLVLISIIPVYAETITSYLLDEGQSGGFEEITVDNDTTLDLTANVLTVPETTETIGGVDVALTQETTFVSPTAEPVTILNSQLTTVTVAIPQLTKLSAPATWDKILQPQIRIPTSGTVPSGFLTPTNAILIGSPDNILVFDRAVTITLAGTTGQTAYKLPGSSTWILIDTCTGTFANPNDPPANGECSISDGTDTKILTFHFTEFSGLSTPAPSTPGTPGTPSTPSSGSGGSGNVGVGSPRVFGPGSSGGSSGGGDYTPTQRGQTVFPAWFDNVKDWYRMGDISATEFLNAYQWIINNL